MKPVQVQQLAIRATPGARVTALRPGVWRLDIPAGPAEQYRLAQLDDCGGLARGRFLHTAPACFELRARVSAAGLAGTWGFGLWNDPFALGLGIGGAAARLPVLPNAAWFFHASPPGYLALSDHHPAAGLLAAVFRSPRLPALVLLPGLALVGLLAWPAAARLLRRLAARIVCDEAVLLAHDPTAWHSYRIDWTADRVRFWLDGQQVSELSASPRGRLGLVIWIDNQFAAFPPTGRLRSGTLAQAEPAWLEVDLSSAAAETRG